jgi:class 3 adenylate cyclase
MSRRIAAIAAMSELPTGAVTFLFTDIEANTQSWERDPAAMQAAHSRYQIILRETIEADSGHAYRRVGLMPSIS